MIPQELKDLHSKKKELNEAEGKSFQHQQKISSIEDLIDQKNVDKPIGICTECKHVMIRKLFDTVINTFELIQCKFSNFVDIEQFPVLECTQFEPVDFEGDENDENGKTDEQPHDASK